MHKSFLTMSVLLLAATPAYSQVGYRDDARAVPANSLPNSQGMLFQHDTFQSAWAAGHESQRPVLLYVTSNNCLYCKKMLRQTLSNPQVSRMIGDHAESYAFNATQMPELAKRLGVRGFPATLIISPDRELLYQIDGFVEPQEFVSRVWPVFEDFETRRYASQGR